MFPILCLSLTQLRIGGLASLNGNPPPYDFELECFSLYYLPDCFYPMNNFTADFFDSTLTLFDLPTKNLTALLDSSGHRTAGQQIPLPDPNTPWPEPQPLH